MARERLTTPGTAIGFTVKSGWTCAVLIAAGSPPRVLDSVRIDVSDPAIPESRQPYHEGFGRARRAGEELSRLIASVQQFGHAAVTVLLKRYQAEGHHVVGVGIVVGSLIDPSGWRTSTCAFTGSRGSCFGVSWRTRLPETA